MASAICRLRTLRRQLRTTVIPDKSSGKERCVHAAAWQQGSFCRLKPAFLGGDVKLRRFPPRHTAWLRPHYSPSYALCSTGRAVGGPTRSWGVTPFVVPFDLINPENTIETALKILVEQAWLRKGTTVVIIGSILVGEQIVDAVQMRVV
ncbi:MAG: hypothetical protein ABSA45_03600 [Verrucomicrobiota bacterium]|jgi:hypothetical protein